MDDFPCSLDHPAGVVPVPTDVHWPVTIIPGRRYFVAKSIHVCAYALLSLLTGWLQPRYRRRLALLFFLMAHASGTEWVQSNLSYRTGTVTDVVLDHCGIAAGLLLGWKWWAGEGTN